MPKDREEPLNLPNYYHDDQTKLENQIGRRRRDAKNPNGLPQSNKMTTPHKSPFLSFYSPRREGHYNRRAQIFHSFQRGIFALILKGEIDGALTRSSLFDIETLNHSM